MGVEIYFGFFVVEVLFYEDGCVKGVVMGDMGVLYSGEYKFSY